MKDKKLINKEYIEKIKKLKKYDELYYEKSNPKINDSDYDELKKEILELEKKFKFLKTKDSPSLSVGFEPSKNFQKSKHRVRMLSLSNAFDYKDLENFEKKISNFLNLKNRDKLNTVLNQK